MAAVRMGIAQVDQGVLPLITMVNKYVKAAITQFVCHHSNNLPSSMPGLHKLPNLVMRLALSPVKFCRCRSRITCGCQGSSVGKDLGV